MSVTLDVAVAAFLAGATLAALVAERLTRPRPFDAHADEALATVAERHPTRLAGAFSRPVDGSSPWRCLLCPDAPVVPDPVTHSRLAHTYRETGPEDRSDWAAR
jgi:hypothetical protein